MVSSGDNDIVPDDSGGGRLLPTDHDDLRQDPVAAMHDVEAEAGDEAGLSDTFVLDVREAKELGVDLDPTGSQESELD